MSAKASSSTAVDPLEGAYSSFMASVEEVNAELRRACDAAARSYTRGYSDSVRSSDPEVADRSKDAYVGAVRDANPLADVRAPRRRW